MESLMERLLREEREEKERKRRDKKEEKERNWRASKLAKLRRALHPDAIIVDRSNVDTIHDTVDIDTYLGFNRSVDKNDYLAMEKQVWSAAMDYWKSKDICNDYDLIPDNMIMYPVVFESHTWYHCNLLGQRRDSTCPGCIKIFVEVKKCRVECMKISYDVTACIPLDDNDCYHCRVCPASRDILHPLKGGFICGSKEGQNVFNYTIPVPILWS